MIEFIDVNYRVGEYAILTGINLKIRGGECGRICGFDRNKFEDTQG